MTLLLLSRLFSPLLVLPVIAAGLLELTGVWTPTMVWTDGTLELRSALLELGDAPLLIPLLLLLSAFRRSWACY